MRLYYFSFRISTNCLMYIRVEKNKMENNERHLSSRRVIENLLLFNEMLANKPLYQYIGCKISAWHKSIDMT